MGCIFFIFNNGYQNTKNKCTNAKLHCAIFCAISRVYGTGQVFETKVNQDKSGRKQKKIAKKINLSNLYSVSHKSLSFNSDRFVIRRDDTKIENNRKNIKEIRKNISFTTTR